jgi:CrcB protein
MAFVGATMTETVQEAALIATGGALGSCLRYEVGRFVTARLGVGFPWGTLLVNVTGSFLLGVFLTVALERARVDPRVRLFVAVGFCGGYTTFSTFAYETLRLLEERSFLLAAANVAGSSVAGLAAVFAGALLARRFT